jgi:hypothetical protein
MPATGKTARGVLLSIRPESFVMKNKGENCICGEIMDNNFMGDYNELVCEVHTGNGSREEVVIRISPEPCLGQLFENNPEPYFIDFIRNSKEQRSFDSVKTVIIHRMLNVADLYNIKRQAG